MKHWHEAAVQQHANLKPMRKDERTGQKDEMMIDNPNEKSNLKREPLMMIPKHGRTGFE